MADKHILKFREKHNLGFDLYEASDDSLRYSNTFIGNRTKEFDDDPRDLAPSKTSEDEENMRAHMLGYPVFAGKVRLTWHDYNDNPIEYSFDFNDIFPDKIIPYPKELEDLIFWAEPIDGTPGIILEIIDRTLNIYTIVDLNVRIPNTDLVKSKSYHEKVYTKEF